jgi:PAS domain S-box-containing protein
MTTAPANTHEQHETVRILHVDDDRDVAELTATFLIREDDRFEIETAHTVPNGLDLLSQSVFDCIISDYDMPSRNGIEFLKAVREDYPDLPFILYTGNGSEEISSEAISAGVTDYLRKESGTDQYTTLANRVRNAVEQYWAEREIEHTRTQLQAIADNCADTILVIDTESRIRFANAAVEEHFGYTPVKLRGEQLTTIIPKRHREDYFAAIDQYVETSERSLTCSDIEFSGAHRDGTEIPLSISFSEFEQKGNQLFIGIIRDISEHKEHEHERERTIEWVTDAIVEVDADWTFSLVNEQAETLYGMSEECLLGRNVWDVFEDAKNTRFEEEFRWVMESGEPTSFIEYVSQLDGWFDVEAYPKEDGGITCYFTEVTEQRERQRELEAEREFISEALDTLDDIFYVVGPNGDLQRWNERVVEATGYSKSELTEMSAIEIFPDNERSHIAESIETTLETGVDRVEVEIQTDNGARMPYEFVNRRLTDSEGELLGIVGIGRDLTDVKAKEQELRETKRRLDLVLGGTETGIWEWKIGTDKIEWDDTLERMFGLDTSSFEGTYEGFAKRVHPNDLSRVEEAMDQAIENNELYHTEFRMIHEDEETVWAEVQGVVIEEKTEPDRLIGLYREITERKRHEEQLEAFAFVVSHDLRNPLNVASGYLELTREECESGHLERVAEAHSRMDELIENLLTLAREGDRGSGLEPVNLASLAESCWENVATTEAMLTIDIDEEIRANPSRLQQLLENLIRNAVEHGGEDVAVTVGTLESGFYIEDDGPGIPEDEQNDVFEMGYSTQGGGTGFGLSITKQVANTHDWVIGVTDGSKGGARFEITDIEFVTE